MSEPDLKHEPDAAIAGGLLILLTSTLLVVALLSLGLWLGFQAISDSVDKSEGAWSSANLPPQSEDRDTVAPALQENPPADLTAFNDHMQARLQSAGWVDRQAGIVHMPIERAMDLLVERGLTEGDPWNE